MKLQIDGNPDYGQLRVHLSPGETFLAEGGAMSWMDVGMNVKARLMGGLMRALRPQGDRRPSPCSSASTHVIVKVR